MYLTLFLGSYFAFGLGASKTSTTAKDHNRHIFTLDTIDWKIGVDDKYKTYSSVNLTGTYTFTLFARNLDTSSFASYGYEGPYNYGYFGKARFYGMKVYLGTNLVMDLIPAKDKDGVACIYDKLAGKCIYNQGTGNFIASEN